jgi:glycerate 2-kinase
MKIVIAPDSFKESLPAELVAKAIHDGFIAFFPDAEYHLLPIADGGEGTIQSLASANQAVIKTVSVTGPLSEPVQAKIAFSSDGKRAYIEMAEACGLHLVSPEERNPLNTTTFGVGELILYAMDSGAIELVIGVGGSATNDGGIGMATALGYQFYNQEGVLVRGIGQDLFHIESMTGDHRDHRLDEVEITIAADVENPLTGSNGATYVYGPQKGLKKEMLEEADNALGSFYKKACSHFNKEVMTIPGSGAGGGIGAGLLLFTNAEIKKGIDLVLEELDVRNICKDADLVIVGEGRMDGQTLNGKAPLGVAACSPPSSKVIAICGSIGDGSENLYEHGIQAVFPTIPALLPAERIMNDAYNNIKRTARNIAALL